MKHNVRRKEKKFIKNKAWGCVGFNLFGNEGKNEQVIRCFFETKFCRFLKFYQNLGFFIKFLTKNVQVF